MREVVHKHEAAREREAMRGCEATRGRQAVSRLSIRVGRGFFFRFRPHGGKSFS